jgi:uncharacterized protein YrzB (UPF0473 family)
MNCPECGIPVENDAHFCPKCYARIEPPGLLRRLGGFFRGLFKPGVHVIKTEKKVKITTVDSDGNRHDYHSVNEVPLAQRAQFEKMETEANEQARAMSAELAQTPSPPGLVKVKAASVFKIKDALGQERVYHSLEELPPEVRERLAKLMPGLGGKVNHLAAELVDEPKPSPDLAVQEKTEVYKIKDKSGQERVYHSLEELPPEYREMFKRFRK